MPPIPRRCIPHPVERLATLALATLCALAGCGRTDSAAPTDRGTPAARANVIVLVMDTVRADRCSLNGYERPTTPRLAHFAAGAATFTQAWTPARWTVPSHATLFTGLVPRNHGARPSHRSSLDPDVPTLAEILSRAGYATGAFVSNPAFELDAGLYRGFDVTQRHYGLQRPKGDSGALAPVVHALARAWVAETRAAQRPFFLFVNDIDPHSPYQPDAAVQERFVAPGIGADALDAGRRFAADDALRHNFGGTQQDSSSLALLSDLYDAEIATLDASVGDLLDALAGDGALDDTIVVVTSDHGEYLGAHGLLDHMQGVHQDILHVPLVVRAPGRLDDGRRVDDVVRLEDVAPTILELCDVAGPAAMDGHSLLGDVRDRVARGESTPNPYVISAALRQLPLETVEPHLLGSRSVLLGTWRLIDNDDGTLELYDHVTDPAESVDVAGAHPDVVARLRELVDQEP